MGKLGNFLASEDSKIKKISISSIFKGNVMKIFSVVNKLY